MKFRKVRGEKRWESGDYTIEKSEFGLGLFNVYGPKDTSPPHYRRTVGGCSTLETAKRMARKDDAQRRKGIQR